MGSRGMKSEIDWEKLDWKKQDVQLAKENGVSRQRANQMRKELKKRKAVHKRYRMVSAYSKLLTLNTSHMTLEELAKKFNYTEEYIGAVLERMGKKHKPNDRRCIGGYDWGSITLHQFQTLTDKKIADKLGIKFPCVVAMHRKRRKIKKIRPAFLKREKKAESVNPEGIVKD
jgi:hypothetical protein